MLFDREKKVKAKLVNTRKIIQDKFKKVRRDRIKRENDMQEKYKPITHAINKLTKEVEKPIVDNNDALNSSSDELEWDYDDYNTYLPMDWDTFSEPGQQLVSRKKLHMRDDDDDMIRKRLRKSSSKRSAALSKKIMNRRRLKEVTKRVIKSKRLESKGPSNEIYPDEVEDDYSDTVIETNDDRNKRLRLEKSALDEKSNQMRLKNNKKNFRNA